MSDQLTRAVVVKLDVGVHGALLSQTAVAFNVAATSIARVCWDEGITNSNTAHHRVYGETRRRFGLGAQLAVCARAKAMEAIKATRARGEDTCPTFGPTGSVRYDARTYRLLALDDVSLNTMRGRVICRLLPGAHQHTMLVDPAWTIGGAELVQRAGTWALHIVQHTPAPQCDAPTAYLGVDLGIVNLATDSTGESFSGADVQRVRKRRFQHRQSLQKTNTRRARARLRKNARREARFQKDINHCMAKALVAKAKASCKALALEDLTGINARTTVRHDQRRARMSWAFFQLRTFVAYKAQTAGVRVVFVDPRDTSRTCSRPECGYCDKRNRPDQAHFRCLQCGFTLPADYNAAINIAARATVNWPIVLPPCGYPMAIASTSSLFLGGVVDDDAALDGHLPRPRPDPGRAGL
jgi:putative transposase